MFALIDCNNFYASCERLFRPDLRQKPVIVLSNNDGCVIALSNEAKKLGIKMGIPYFEVKQFCREHNVQVFSSNYTLYGDLSERVMRVIEENWPHTEIYSIDEAFLNLTGLKSREASNFCEDLQKKIFKFTGIPVSIGIGKTKTLSKIANRIAKKILQIPLFDVTDQYFWLEKIEVGDIWGVGRQWERKLRNFGVRTAADLTKLNLAFVRKNFNVVLQRTIMELNGIPCLELEVPEPKQSIISSCSFGGVQNNYLYVREAISHHCATAWAKMRDEGLLAQHLSVFIRSNPFREDLKQYSNMVGFRLVNPTDDIQVLTKMAKFCLKKIYRPEIHYHKSGVILADLIDKKYRQGDLFNQPEKSTLLQTETLMNLMGSINEKYGSRTIRLASEGFKKQWNMRRELKSPNYTTQWLELPTVYVR